MMLAGRMQLQRRPSSVEFAEVKPGGDRSQRHVLSRVTAIISATPLRPEGECRESGPGPNGAGRGQNVLIMGPGRRNESKSVQVGH